MDYKITVDDAEVINKLHQLGDNTNIKTAIIRRSLIRLKNRSNTLTPINKNMKAKDRGFLRKSVTAVVNEGMFGFTAEYAPHVEYGHRTRGGGFVKGQRYLQKNIEFEKKELIEDARAILERVVNA